MQQKHCNANNITYGTLTSFSACGTKPFEGAKEKPRKVDAKIDIIFPEVTFPSNKLYKEWGEKNIEKMVLYHHELLRKSVVGDIFPKEDTLFETATKKTVLFFLEALGGGEKYTSVHGHPALRNRHFHITIDEKAREIWLMLYKKTIKDMQMPVEYIEEFWNWIEALSIRMINRRTSVMDIERYPYSSVFHETSLIETEE